VDLVGFIIRIYHSARSSECPIWRICLLGYDTAVDCYRFVYQTITQNQSDLMSQKRSFFAFTTDRTLVTRACFLETIWALLNLCIKIQFCKKFLLTYSMVQSPSWEANWFAASQGIPRISRNPKVHYRTHKPPPPVPNLGQPNTVHIPTSHLLEIHLNSIHPSTSRSPQWSPSFRFSQQDRIHPPLLTHTRHMPILEKALEFILCFVDRLSRYICVIKTNLKHYLSSVYFVNKPLHVSAIFVAHHQEVYCIYTAIGTCCWLRK